MRILFRTDANAQIGTGHLMRCLALAEGLRDEGAECTFLCRAAGLGVMDRKISEAGHELLTLTDNQLNDAIVDSPQLAHADWLPSGQLNDVSACLSALEGQLGADWVIVDHYALDERWEIAMRCAAKRIMVIDDLADRVHQCDVLLDQNVLSETETGYRELVPETCGLLLGPKFALLRAEFSKPFSHSLEFGHHSSGQRLLIMFGGSDPQNLTLRAVMALVRISWKGGVDVVVGSLYQNVKEISALLESLPDANLHVQANNIADLMRKAKFAIGSPGVASWERCACALPSITLSAAGNQMQLGETLALLGAHWYLGLTDEVSDTQLDAALIVWGNNSIARKSMQNIAAKMCDGKGVQRVVRRLMSTNVVLRPAGMGDVSMLYRWRNDERIRQQSLDSQPLELTTHLAWCSSMFKKMDSKLLLACCDSVPVACIRLDFQENRARVSIYTDPELQGHGFGSATLAAGLDWLHAERPEVTITEADVLLANQASDNLFSSAGFYPVWTRYEYSSESAC